VGLTGGRSRAEPKSAYGMDPDFNTGDARRGPQTGASGEQSM
jgi:hypothetical protein